MNFGTIDQAIEDLRNGRIIIVADDEDRENEGDLVCAAELVTPEMINFMALHGRGLICLALTAERCDQLGLPQQVALYDELCAAGAAPPVIDAGDFLRNPKGYLQALCDWLGIPFTTRMLRWPPGPRASDGVKGPCRTNQPRCRASARSRSSPRWRRAAATRG